LSACLLRPSRLQLRTQRKTKRAAGSQLALILNVRAEEREDVCWGHGQPLRWVEISALSWDVVTLDPQAIFRQWDFVANYRKKINKTFLDMATISQPQSGYVHRMSKLARIAVGGGFTSSEEPYLATCKIPKQSLLCTVQSFQLRHKAQFC